MFEKTTAQAAGDSMMQKLAWCATRQILALFPGKVEIKVANCQSQNCVTGIDISLAVRVPRTLPGSALVTHTAICPGERRAPLDL